MTLKGGENLLHEALLNSTTITKRQCVHSCTQLVNFYGRSTTRQERAEHKQIVPRSAAASTVSNVQAHAADPTGHWSLQSGRPLENNNRIRGHWLQRQRRSASRPMSMAGTLVGRTRRTFPSPTTMMNSTTWVRTLRTCSACSTGIHAMQMQS